MTKAARIIRRWDASICQHSEGVMGTDSSQYAAIVSTLALKRRIMLASLILEMKIVCRLQTTLDQFFPEAHLEAFQLRRQDREGHCRFREYIRLSFEVVSAENCVQRAGSSFFKLILRPTFDAFISIRRNFLKIYDFIDFNACIFMYIVLHKSVPLTLLSKYSMSSSKKYKNDFYVVFARTRRKQFSITIMDVSFFYFLHLWNSLHNFAKLSS